MRPLTFVAALLAGSVAWGSAMAAEDPRATFEGATQALNSGNVADAIAALERLADEGHVEPDASFNRGIAYVRRYQEDGGQPGDLGRASAAFEEALLLRPGDADARRALDLVRAEITRKAARHGTATLEVHASWWRALIGFFPENFLRGVGLLWSVITSAALLLRKWGPTTWRALASTGAGMGAVLLLSFLPAVLYRRHMAEHERVGVVIAETRLLVGSDQKRGVPVPEGARVYVTGREGSMMSVFWGSEQGVIPATQVRLLADGR